MIMIAVDPASEVKGRPKPPDILNLEFGSVITDHLFSMDWNEKSGWHNAVIAPYDTFDLGLKPAAKIFHYGQAIFEGAKARYAGPDKFLLFRIGDHAKRFNRSAKRLAMPRIKPADFEAAITGLIGLDFDWIPREPECALYIRPMMIATEHHLKASVSATYKFLVILCPVGPYFKSGLKPQKLFVSDKYARAADGGVGEAKTSGNYAAGLFASREAQSKGYNQVLWLDAKEHKKVEEAGVMNVFFVIGDRTLITPPLGGTILPGITRDSILKIARDRGLIALKMSFSIDDVLAMIKSGEITEIFGTGTAAVISPIGELFYQSKKIVLDNTAAGPVTRMLYDELTGIQNGTRPDPYHWVKTITL